MPERGAEPHHPESKRCNYAHPIHHAITIPWCFCAQGSVKLDRGTTHLLRRSDVEHLVRQGLLQELENEST